MNKRLRTNFVSVLALAILSLSFLLPAQPAAAVSCSGNGCSGKDPISTGCNQNAYLAKRYVVTDKYGLAIWQTFAEVYYSRSCGTNWLRVNQNPFGGNAFKSIWTSSYTENETDYGYGSSYSMQVYAPGTTSVGIQVLLKDKSGVSQGFVYARL